ncbi:MAG: CDGSH iron-sulfur domain-containing protein [Solirubrobacterales bacterium]
MDELSITAYPNGPYLVRGPVRLFNRDGDEVELRRRTIAVCRCGRSRIHPLCDGTHKITGFRAEGGAGADAGRLATECGVAVEAGADDPPR